MSSPNCCFLTCMQVSHETGRVVWCSHLFNNVLQSVVLHTVKGFSVVNETDLFLEFPCFLYDPTDVGNLTFGSSAFSKSILCIWMFLVHVLLKLSLKDFEHNLTSMWNEYNCALIWTFFGIALLWDWNESQRPFPFLWPLLSFPNLLTYWMQHLIEWYHLLGF